jgi:hypothetical protein
MAGPWEKYSGAAAAPAGPWSKYGAQEDQSTQQFPGRPTAPGDVAGTKAFLEQKHPEPPGFWRSLYNSTIGGLGELLSPPKPEESQPPNPFALLTGRNSGLVPQRMVTGAVAGAKQEARKTAAELKAGHPIEALGHGMATALPVLGPAAAHAGETLASGDFAGGGGETAGLLLPFGLSKAAEFLPKNPTVGPILRDVNTPEVRSALDYTKGKGVRISAGQETGNRGVTRLEQGLENFPGSSTRTHEFLSGQQGELSGLGRDLAQRVSPIKTSEVGAGEALQQRMTQRLNTLKSQMDNLYSGVRSTAESFKKNVPGPPKQSSIVDVNGNPIMTPTTQTFETPISLNPIRSGLSDVYEELNRSLPDARKASSPAFTSLKNLMDNPNPYMNAMDFDKTLSALKSITRDGNNPLLSNRSQGLAKLMIKQGEGEMQNALSAADPGLPAKLRAARTVAKTYYDTADFINDMHSEPAQLYSNLVTGGDRVINTLQELNKVAPAQLKTVGRTFLDHMVDKATAEGGFQRGAGVLQDWNRLGPQTKNLIYGPQLTTELDKFFLAAKKIVQSQNPSGSAHMIAALKGAGIAGAALTEMFTGHPLAGIGTAAVGFGAPNIAARMLFTPGGVRLLTKVLSVPAGSAEFQAAARALEAGAAAQQTTNPTTKSK